MSAHEVFLAYITENGLMMTPQRSLIVNAFLETDGHFSTEQLYDVVRQRDATIGLTTVYRTLRLLVEAGLAESFDAGDGVTTYEQQHRGKHHDHLICTACGKKVEVYSAEIEERQERVAEEHGFELRHHQLLLYGLCLSCREAARNKSKDE